jgi:predicted HicB family RNase H-like nuclease
MAILNYKGFTGKLEVDLNAQIIKGHVLDSRDVVTFQGNTVNEAKQSFQDAIDDYLEICTELSKNPMKYW